MDFCNITELASFLPYGGKFEGGGEGDRSRDRERSEGQRKEWEGMGHRPSQSPDETRKQIHFLFTP